MGHGEVVLHVHTCGVEDRHLPVPICDQNISSIQSAWLSGSLEVAPALRVTRSAADRSRNSIAVQYPRLSRGRPGFKSPFRRTFCSPVARPYRTMPARRSCGSRLHTLQRILPPCSTRQPAWPTPARRSSTTCRAPRIPPCIRWRVQEGRTRTYPLSLCSHSTSPPQRISAPCKKERFTALSAREAPRLCSIYPCVMSGPAGHSHTSLLPALAQLADWEGFALGELWGAHLLSTKGRHHLTVEAHRPRAANRVSSEHRRM